MEKKIEILEAKRLALSDGFKCLIKVDGYKTFSAYGDTDKQAEQNASIAAKGYLVKDMIPHLEDYLKVLKGSFSELSPNVVDLTELLTKAKM